MTRRHCRHLDFLTHVGLGVLVVLVTGDAHETPSDSPWGYTLELLATLVAKPGWSLLSGWLLPSLWMSTIMVKVGGLGVPLCLDALTMLGVVPLV